MDCHFISIIKFQGLMFNAELYKRTCLYGMTGLIFPNRDADCKSFLKTGLSVSGEKHQNND